MDSIRILCLFLILSGTSALARLGETADQFAARYGAPQDSPASDKNFPLLEGVTHHRYEYEGWKIRAAFIEPDGRAVRIEYSKIIKPGVTATVQDYELQAIMNANTPDGTTWKQIAYNNPDSPNKGLSKLFESYFGGALGQKMWQRSDGATFGYAANSLSAWSFPQRANTKQNSKRKRNRKPVSQCRNFDEVWI